MAAFSRSCAFWWCPRQVENRTQLPGPKGLPQNRIQSDQSFRFQALTFPIQFAWGTTCHFARDLLRGSSSRIALDRGEAEVNLIVDRERPRQTAAWEKPGRLEIGAPSAIDQDSEPGFLAFGGEFYQEEHRRERDGKIPPQSPFCPTRRFPAPVGPKLGGMPRRATNRTKRGI